MNDDPTRHPVPLLDGQRSETVRDPVCGMKVDPKSAASTESFKGQTYFFCNPQCLAKFRSEPMRYVEPKTSSSVEPPPSSAATKDEYTCPMHPEVRQQATGACPKCGMALEPVAPPVASRTEYICPMHLEIVRSEPGSCPICGMALEPKTISLGDEQNPELADMKRRFLVSLILTIPVLIAAMREMIPGEPLQQLASQRTWTWIELILSSPVILWGGWPFFVRGWQSIVNRSLNMFTLISLRLPDPGGGCSHISGSGLALIFLGIMPSSHMMDLRGTPQRWSCSDNHSFQVFRMVPLKSAPQSAS